MLLRELEWKVNIPTPFEFAAYFLYLANPDFDFQQILFASTFITFEYLKGNFYQSPDLVYSDYTLSRFEASTIAIVSIQHSLE